MTQDFWLRLLFLGYLSKRHSAVKCRFCAQQAGWQTVVPPVQSLLWLQYRHCLSNSQVFLKQSWSRTAERKFSIWFWGRDVGRNYISSAIACFIHASFILCLCLLQQNSLTSTWWESWVQFHYSIIKFHHANPPGMWQLSPTKQVLNAAFQEIIPSSLIPFCPSCIRDDRKQNTPLSQLVKESH